MDDDDATDAPDTPDGDTADGDTADGDIGRALDSPVDPDDARDDELDEQLDEDVLGEEKVAPEDEEAFQKRMAEERSRESLFRPPDPTAL